jgi:hypothetical protein
MLTLTGSMNCLFCHAKFCLTERALSVHDASFELIDMPMSSVCCQDQREAFKALSTHAMKGGASLAECE